MPLARPRGSRSSALVGLALVAVARVASADPPAPPSPRPAPAQVALNREERTRRAMALHDEAWVLYENGRYRAAIERLEAALRIDPEGRELVYNLGLIHEKLGDLREATAYYRRYAEMETDPRAKARVQVTIRRLEGAEQEAAAQATAQPAAPAAPASSNALSPARRSWAIATGGLAAGALATGIGFGLTAIVRSPGETPHTGGGVTIASLQADAHAAHTDAVVADIAFIVSAAATATAALIVATGTHRSPVGLARKVLLGAGKEPSPLGLGVSF